MNERPTHLDLFSGIGGFALAAQWAGFRTIGFCEIDPYCRKVLAKNFLANTGCVGNGAIQYERIGGSNPKADIGVEGKVRIFSNIFDLDGTAFRGVTLITGGFPCQPFSVAGKRRGAADDRAIWPEMFRVISEARPAWVLGENVPGIIPMELDNVLSDLEGIGYATRAFVIPACAVDARHRRDRLWIVGRFVGNTTSEGSFSGAQRGICGSEESARPRDAEPERRGEAMVESNGARCEHAQEMYARGGFDGEGESDYRTASGASRWLPEPDVGGTFDGLSCWLDGYGGLNGATKIEFASEAVCPLWDRVFTQRIREPACISSEAVLLAFVCKLKKWEVDEAWIQLACEKALEAEVRGVRFDVSAYCPSCRSRHSEQHAREHPDFVQVLSRLLVRHAEKAWTEYRRSDAAPVLGWETGYARVAHGVQKRVDRLKGLGNAIVPQVAFEILREIRKLKWNQASQAKRRRHE